MFRVGSGMRSATDADQETGEDVDAKRGIGQQPTEVGLTPVTRWLP